MKSSNHRIITAAVTGSIHVPSQSKYLPISPEEITAAAIEAAEAGAAIVHLHARSPDGRPAHDPQLFVEIVSEIQKHSDVVVNISTGGSPVMKIEDRIAAAIHLRPPLASLNMGSMNFVFADAAARISAWKYDWEKPYLLKSFENPFINSFADINSILARVGGENGSRFEFECYDIGHLYTLAYFAERGAIEPPFFIQGVFGVLGGIGADPDNVTHMVKIADKLFGDDYYFSAFGAGRHQMAIATQSALLGGNVRVGLEDSIWLRKGVLAQSSGQQVALIRNLLEGLGLEIATPSEAREMLSLN